MKNKLTLITGVLLLSGGIMSAQANNDNCSVGLIKGTYTGKVTGYTAGADIKDSSSYRKYIFHGIDPNGNRVDKCLEIGIDTVNLINLNDDFKFVHKGAIPVQLKVSEYKEKNRVYELHY